MAADAIQAPVSASAMPGESQGRYCITDLTGFAADPDQFYDFAYRDTLRSMVAAVIETESPLRTDKAGVGSGAFGRA